MRKTGAGRPVANGGLHEPTQSGVNVSRRVATSFGMASRIDRLSLRASNRQRIGSAVGLVCLVIRAEAIKDRAEFEGNVGAAVFIDSIDSEGAKPQKPVFRPAQPPLAARRDHRGADVARVCRERPFRRRQGPLKPAGAFLQRRQRRQGLPVLRLQSQGAAEMHLGRFGLSAFGEHVAEEAVGLRVIRPNLKRGPQALRRWRQRVETMQGAAPVAQRLGVVGTQGQRLVIAADCVSGDTGLLFGVAEVVEAFGQQRIAGEGFAEGGDGGGSVALGQVDEAEAVVVGGV